MTPSKLWLAIFGLQGAAIFFDEFWFHVRRGLPRWERIGHPLDTLTVLIPFVFTLWIPSSEASVWIFVGLSIFSCVFVTKDEFVHKELCPAAESWLHSVLFLLHPLAFIVAGLIWSAGASSDLRFAVVGQSVLIFSFLIYQIVYWSFVWKPPRHAPAPPLTTTSTTRSETAGTPLTTIR